MSSNVGGSLEHTLLNTITLASNQCQNLIKSLSRNEQIIEDLRKENRQLKEELKTLRGRPNDDFKGQLQDVFMQLATKQSEIDSLKQKVRAVKAKARNRGLTDLISSSPVPSPTYGRRGSPRPSSGAESHIKTEPAGEDGPSIPRVGGIVSGTRSTTRKRGRSPSLTREPLRTITPNIGSRTRNSKHEADEDPKRQQLTDEKIAAIQSLAEDGDDDFDGVKKKHVESKHTLMPDSVYYRLGNLLDNSGQDERPVLSKARSASPPKIRLTNSNLTTSNPASPALSGAMTSTSSRFKKSRTSLATSKRPGSPAPEDEELLRARPMHRLNLNHFKLNQSANDGLDYAYTDTVRGQARQCLPGCTRPCCVGYFRALTDTLPQIRGPNGLALSDHDLLLGFLGHGSEERINSLTPKARENLLHEARTKVVADTYGKMHRDTHERGRSPPGFWRTDMPGSQELRGDREAAKLLEREEVSRRYNEAMKAGGRWAFADE